MDCVCQVESEAGFDLCDLRLMVDDQGLHGQCLSDAVIALHTSLQRTCHEAGVAELLSTTQLLHCARLCKQQLDLGVAMETALTDAALDSYVRCVHSRSVAKVSEYLLCELKSSSLHKTVTVAMKLFVTL